MALVSEATMQLATDAVKEAVLTVPYNGIAPANASGQLANSIVSVPNVDGFNVVATGEAARYVMTLRYGRRPGKYPPPGVILQWMDVKGIAVSLPQNRRRGIAFAIGRKMQQSGNYIYRNNLTPTAIWDGAVEKITKAVAADVVSMIVRAL